MASDNSAGNRFFSYVSSSHDGAPRDLLSFQHLSLQHHRFSMGFWGRPLGDMRNAYAASGNGGGEYQLAAAEIER
jgi:hypothetical protein